MKKHTYYLDVEWTGNSGLGTKKYDTYERSYQIVGQGKPVIEGSSDPSFRGDLIKYNPEELFLASISSCHMLWYLHLCAVNNVNVLQYHDKPLGTMLENANGSGQFEQVILFPTVVVEHAIMLDKAISLHFKSNKMCFIANSCNFEIHHQPQVTVQSS